MHIEHMVHVPYDVKILVGLV